MVEKNIEEGSKERNSEFSLRIRGECVSLSCRSDEIDKMVSLDEKGVEDRK